MYHLALITRCCQYNPFGRKFDENRGRYGNNGYGGKEVFVRQCLSLTPPLWRDLVKISTFGLGNLENGLLTSRISEGAQGIFSKITFLKSGRSNEKDEACHSFLVEIFTKFTEEV